MEQNVETRIKELLSSHFFEGAMLLLFGAIMLLFPAPSKKIICIIMGCVLLLIGLILAVDFFRSRGRVHPMVLFGGLLALVLGVQMAVSPSSYLILVQAVLSITLVYTSVLLNIQAYSLRYERGRLFVITVAFSILAVAFAAVMLIKPLGEGNALIRIKGLSLIMEGLAALFVIRSRAH
ncbi:MAG: DUF308 domain-containing protein [Clostridiales bacterium]|nr:DUF308 domain-containing protein [Clostridiales bacterium]